MIGVFAAQDLFLFYIFFEGGLIPMYLIIGIWGGAERIKASYKFFLYTLLGSVLMLIAMIYMVMNAGTTSIPALMAYRLPARGADVAVAGLLRQLRGQDADVAGAHLAARRARPGADRRLGDPRRRAAQDGRLRLHPLLAADVPRRLGAIRAAGLHPVGIAVVYTSLVALVQRDMKKLIAYSSVAHMAFVTFGLFAFNRQGIEGAMIVMLSHGLVSGALFLCVGVIYDRLHTREIERYGGLAEQHARLCPAVHAVHHGQRRPAGHQRLRRRVPEPWSAPIACRPGRRSSPPPASSWARPTCCGSTGGSPSALQRNADAAAMPDLQRANGGCWRRSPRWCCGWASIPKASCARSAPMSGACSKRVERAAPPGDSHVDRRQARAAEAGRSR